MKRLISVLSILFMVMLFDSASGASVIELNGSSGLSFAIEDDVSSGLSFAIEDDVSSGLSFAIENDVSSGGSFVIELLGGSAESVARFSQYEFLVH